MKLVVLIALCVIAFTFAARKATNHCGDKAKHFSTATLNCEESQKCCENGSSGQCVLCNTACPTGFTKASDATKHGSKCKGRKF